MVGACDHHKVFFQLYTSVWFFQTANLKFYLCTDHVLSLRIWNIHIFKWRVSCQAANRERTSHHGFVRLRFDLGEKTLSHASIPPNQTGTMAKDACYKEVLISAECVRSIRRKYELCVMHRAGQHIYMVSR